jgi:hypothetical protein
MAGLVPAIHAFNQFSQSKTFREARDLPKQDVDIQNLNTQDLDTRDKPGHDDFGKY